MKTNFKAKCTILADLWLNYRTDQRFGEFIEYNDLGLPLAYAISEKIVEPTDRAKMCVNETWELLLGELSAEDQGFSSFADLLAAEDTAWDSEDD